MEDVVPEHQRGVVAADVVGADQEPRNLCPENKITPELAGKRALGLHPIVVGCDECQRWFEHPTHGKELIAIAEDLVRRGPAAGIIVIFATQRPDAKSLPAGISGNAILSLR